MDSNESDDGKRSGVNLENKKSGGVQCDVIEGKRTSQRTPWAESK